MYRNLPKAIWISIILVTVIYTLANIAYFTTVSREEVLGGAAVAVMFSKRLYGIMWWLMPIFVSLSTFGGVNGILFTTARLFYVGGREGHMPKVLSMIQIKRLTPMPAVVFMGLLSLVYLTSSDMYALINYVSFVNWLAIGMSIIVLLYFRYSRPNIDRPIKMESLCFYRSYLRLYQKKAKSLSKQLSEDASTYHSLYISKHKQLCLFN
ncbi:hypothetical protein KUTeg_001098 [Tegillarca granosa]|uniref:Uncharacterized protein n=1 Tax=Tegillarca granosa TaxID=220873 RepID=A0ABQ9FVS4_TEGGR|nr:hypothetical protein KUTeg_001098 [Tegillarca granosa]